MADRGQKIARRARREDWPANGGGWIEDGDIAPCVIGGCWHEAVAAHKGLCALHELAYIARRGKQSPHLADNAAWVKMLEHRGELL